MALIDNILKTDIKIVLKIFYNVAFDVIKNYTY